MSVSTSCGQAAHRGYGREVGCGIEPRKVIHRRGQGRDRGECGLAKHALGCNRCVRFATAVASGHATLATQADATPYLGRTFAGWIAPACGWRTYSITSSAAGSPEKQKVNDDEGCDYATGTEGEHVANVVSGHALACLDCSFDDPFVVPFRHQGLLFAEVDTAPTGAFSGINAIAVRPFLRVRPRNFQ
jgi:hypothetical protein